MQEILCCLASASTAIAAYASEEASTTSADSNETHKTEEETKADKKPELDDYETEFFNSRKENGMIA